MAEKRNIFLVGPMGAGKSTIGRHLAEMLHLEFYDSDQEIERRTGADIAWVFDLEGENKSRITLGLSVKLLIVNVNVDYNIGTYNSYSAGVMIII